MALASGTAAFADGTADDSSSSDQAAPAAPAPPKAGYSATGTWQLLALVNKRRHAMGLRPLAVDSRLAGIARSWAERMAAQNDLRHNDPLFSRSSHVQLHMKALGENVGWNYSVADQNAAFIASPLHRSNMQLATFRVAGFAVVRDASGRIWSTEDYGTPSGRRAVADPENAEHPRQMRLDRLLADVEPTRDRLVRQTGRDEGEHLALPRAESIGGRPARATVLGQQGARGAWRQRGVPRSRVADGAYDVLGFSVLEQVADRTGFERVMDPLVLAERRQHDDPRGGQRRQELAGRDDAVHPQHRQIHQHDVGTVLEGRRSGRVTVVDGCDDAKVLSTGEQVGQAMPDERVIVNEQDADHVLTSVR
jgi:uncharacterized protein YkwD